jgi:hypothetical protein
VLFPSERRLHQRPGNSGRRRLDTEVHDLAVPFFQLRFVIERIHLACAAVHEQLHDAAHFGFVMKAAVELGLRLRRIGS